MDTHTRTPASVRSETDGAAGRDPRPAAEAAGPSREGLEAGLSGAGPAVPPLLRMIKNSTGLICQELVLFRERAPKPQQVSPALC